MTPDERLDQDLTILIHCLPEEPWLIKWVEDHIQFYNSNNPVVNLPGHLMNEVEAALADYDISMLRAAGIRLSPGLAGPLVANLTQIRRKLRFLKSQ